MLDEPPAPAGEPPRQDAYPRFVGRDAARRRRWDLSMAVAAQLMGEDSSAGQIRSVADVLFQDASIPTD